MTHDEEVLRIKVVRVFLRKGEVVQEITREATTIDEAIKILLELKNVLHKSDEQKK